MNPSFIPIFTNRTMTKTQLSKLKEASFWSGSCCTRHGNRSFAVPSAEAIVLDTGTLVIAPTGVLDLKNNNLIVRSGSVATLTGYITTGRNNGVGRLLGWSGNQQ